MDMIVGRKTLRKLESTINHNSSSKPSSFAMKLMEKMGWKEGEGLGKNNDGIAKHIVIAKREDNIGLGSDTAVVQQESAQDHWWHNSYAQNLQSFKIKLDKKDKKSKKDKKEKKEKKEKKSKKDKKDDDSDSSKSKSKKRKIEEISAEPSVPSYEEMFKATGGARLGMRARREQKGKILRTEGSNPL